MGGKKADKSSNAPVSAASGMGLFRRAYFLVLPHAHLLDLAGPLQMISTLQELRLAHVEVVCIGPQPAVRSFQNVALRELHPLPRRLVDGDVLFVVGCKLDDVLMHSQPWLAAAAWLNEVACGPLADLQVCGVCTGTFLMARAGLLNGRVCTTHHRYVRRLERAFPLVHVVGNRVLVRDGNIWTSAGVASGIDLALHMIAQAYGDDAAIQVARENVVSFRRFGSDPELSAPLRYRAHGNQLVHAVQDAVGRSLSSRMTCATLAANFGLSARHLARVFASEAGITIKRYQIELRMELARRLLVDSALTLESVVERCGFESVQAFRANWNNREPLPPSKMRERMRRSP